MDKYFVIEGDGTINRYDEESKMLEAVDYLVRHDSDISDHDFDEDDEDVYENNIIVIKGEQVKLSFRAVVK